MPNYCDNKVVILGPADAVMAFVEAAKGRANALSGDFYPTERSVIAAVRAGTPIDKAFRDANNRIDRLKDTSAGRPFENLLPERVALKPIPAAGFEDWAAHYEGKREQEPSEGEPTHLSLEALRPMPPEIAAESYHLVGHPWCLTNWGCKAEPTVDAPEIKELPDGRLMAAYPTFDTPNEPALTTFEYASGNHPDLTIINAWAEQDTDDYGYAVAQRGETVAYEKLSSDELDPDCFEQDEEEEDIRWLVTSVLFEKLVYQAVSNLEDENVPCP